jgi:hypothetical protein
MLFGADTFMPNHEEQSSTSPPPVIDCLRVLHYAILDSSVGFLSGHGLFFVGRKEIDRVPCLAICQERDSPQVLLVYCERDWTSLGAASYESVADAKKRAERIYPGSLACWTEARVSEEEAERYLDELFADKRCSFCNNRADVVTQMFSGYGSSLICDKCIEEFHTRLRESS